MSHRRLALVLVAPIAVACGHATTLQRVQFPDGTPHWEYQLADGVPDGPARVWWPNGNMRSQGAYRKGQKDGLFIFYNEEGRFDRQTLYESGVEVWTSQDVTASPSPELTNRDRSAEREPEEARFEISNDPVPAPYFATLDRTTSVTRAGLGIGTGNLRRMEVFANYAISKFGVYGQLMQTDLDAGPMTYSGRRTLELGGTRRFELDDIGTVSARTGLLLPIGNDDANGYVASAAAANATPADAAASFPQAFAVRTGASLTHAQQYLVLQGDAGVDWLLAGQARSFDALLRADAGVGVGMRAAMLGLELTNAVRASDLSRNVSALAITGTLWFAKTWITGAYAYGFSGVTALNILVGHDL